jgi:hypothetical protein
MKKKINKTQKVADHLLKNKKITSIEAFKKWNATRLSSIIYNLRKKGYKIENEEMRTPDGIRFARYVFKGMDFSC